MIFGYSIPQSAKAIAAFLGALVVLLLSANTEFSGIVPESAQGVVAYVAVVLTAVSVFIKKNADTIADLTDGKTPEAG